MTEDLDKAVWMSASTVTRGTSSPSKSSFLSLLSSRRVSDSHFKVFSSSPSSFCKASFTDNTGAGASFVSASEPDSSASPSLLLSMAESESLFVLRNPDSPSFGLLFLFVARPSLVLSSTQPISTILSQSLFLLLTGMAAAFHCS